jgi:hypothetical protein
MCLVVPSSTTCGMKVSTVAAQCEIVMNICSRMEIALLQWKVPRTLTKEQQVRKPAAPLRNEKDAEVDPD